MKTDEKVIQGLENKSILYVSATVHPSHHLHQGVRELLDAKPDIDFGRMVESAGEWVRKYIGKVIDGTSEELPTDLSKYRGIIVGCSLHYTNPDRHEIEPWQERIMDLIRLAVNEYKMPYLGMCGGGQLGLHALGGKVDQNPKGVGFYPKRDGSLVMRTTQVNLTKAGRDNTIFKNMPDTFGINAIHSDYLSEAPEEKGFKVLANAADISNQIVSYGDSAILMGVHPEISSKLMSYILDTLIEDTTYFKMLGANEELLKHALTEVTPTNDVTNNVISNFLSEFCANYKKP